MALVISFLPNPEKAIAEMTRVVRPGGWVATYMWDVPGGGVPCDPIYVALESMGMTSVRLPNAGSSKRESHAKSVGNGWAFLDRDMGNQDTDFILQL